MEQVLERRVMNTAMVDAEAKRHNEQISERYRQLLNAEATQFSSTPVSQARTEEVRASVLERETPVAPVYTAPATETPVLEQAPQVTEFIHERVTHPVFTAEKFERIENFTAPTTTVNEVVMPTYTAPVYEQVASVAVEQEASYSFTPFAKLAMAVAGVLAVGMMSLIGMNSQIIRQKTVRLNDLQQKKQELIAQNEELEQRIANATSEETIRAWAESQIK